MLPRSGCTALRMSVPRSITCAMFSSPWQILMPSTLVLIAGKVLSIRFTSRPFSNGK